MAWVVERQGACQCVRTFTMLGTRTLCTQIFRWSWYHIILAWQGGVSVQCFRTHSVSAGSKGGRCEERVMLRKWNCLKEGGACKRLLSLLVWFLMVWSLMRVLWVQSDSTCQNRYWQRTKWAWLKPKRHLKRKMNAFFLVGTALYQSDRYPGWKTVLRLNLCVLTSNCIWLRRIEYTLVIYWWEPPVIAYRVLKVRNAKMRSSSYSRSKSSNKHTHIQEL